MKKLFFFIMCAFFFQAQGAFAQEKGKKVGNQTLEVKTSVQCEMCEERVQNAFKAQKGVKSVKVNLNNQIVAVTYNSNQIKPEKIRDVIVMAGYDADDKKADQAAYKKLPRCCKKQ